MGIGFGTSLRAAAPRDRRHIAMSAPISSRRLALALRPRTTCLAPLARLPLAARRAASTPSSGTDLSNPLLEKYLAEKEAAEAAETARARKEGKKNSTPTQPPLREGKISTHPSSLFRSERLIPGWRDDLPEATKASLKLQADQLKRAEDRKQELKLSEMMLDPDPSARRNIERRFILRSVVKHGRMTKERKLLRTERSSLYRSTILPTSVKKLTKLMNQIAGKTVSEALVQLRFSKKKVARDVYKGLIIAQDEAIAGRGMGLGSKGAIKRWTEQRNEIVTPSVADPNETMPKPVGNQLIELKDGSKRNISDPTEIYIDQAWVGKGVQWKSPEFRARGRVNMLTHRTTSKPIILPMYL
jgi:ribosomal protein L22